MHRVKRFDANTLGCVVCDWRWNLITFPGKEGYRRGEAHEKFHNETRQEVPVWMHETIASADGWTGD